MFPANHKTVFVLDHTPYFGISSENPIDFDLSKSRGPGYIPLAPICKSLWTCSVEAAVEYCRIVWDLFPDGKLIRFVVSDAAAHILNTWNSVQQNLTHILNGLCMVGPVRRGAGGDVVGLRAAVEALAECSPTQATRQASDRHTINRGRIICVTSARDNTSLRSLADIALNALQQQNKRISNGHAPPTPEAGAPPPPPLMNVHYCHLVIINVTPENADTLVHNQPLYEIGGGVIGVEVHCTTAGQLAVLLGKLVLPHYNLATTTVTGIPMKEEQNASSSANYDVEIIHSIDAHAGLRATALPSEQNDTVTLRWSTPRGAEAGTVSGTLWRVTPVDVASRPSACLVNFLLNGRSVTLEMPRKTGGRSASHVLSAQGGEIWVGALGGRQTHDDPPALSDGPGGRVTDYRIKDLGALMQQNRLWAGRGPGGATRARARLQRHTAYWPLTISSTLLFNLLPMVEPLIRLVVQETLTDDEVSQCRAVLCALLALEARHDSPVSHVAPALRSKWSGSRREELWRQVWREAEALVRAHAASPTHRLLLRALLECRTHGADTTNGAAGSTDASRASVIRATTDSPLSPTSVGPSGDLWTCGGPLGAFMNAPKMSRRPDFAGRMAAGSRPAILYPHLNSNKQEVDTTH